VVCRWEGATLNFANLIEIFSGASILQKCTDYDARHFNILWTVECLVIYVNQRAMVLSNDSMIIAFSRELVQLGLARKVLLYRRPYFISNRCFDS
jgi:hypothetical protein